jgi:hypothetical protein
MAKKKTAKRSKRASLKRNSITVLLIAVAAYAGIHIISRTDGARSLVADKISNGTRLPVALERCGMTPLLGLRLQGLDFYGVRIPDMRIKFSWSAWLFRGKPLVKRLDIDGLEVTFRQVPSSGSWEPLVLHGLGSRFGAVLGIRPPNQYTDEALPKFPAYVINEKTLLQLRRAKVVWQDAEKRELAYLSDADSRVRIVTFSDRKALQVQIKCGHIKLVTGHILRDFELEAIRIDGYNPVLVLQMSDGDGQYEGFQSETLWQDLYYHLSQLAEIQ